MGSLAEWIQVVALGLIYAELLALRQKSYGHHGRLTRLEAILKVAGGTEHE